MLTNKFKLIWVFYIADFLKNSRAKLSFHAFSVVGEKISYVVLSNLYRL